MSEAPTSTRIAGRLVSMIGMIIDGYRLEAQLGEPGGFGTAYKASKNGLDYVVKVILRNGLDPIQSQRFHREVRSLQKVKHPNVVEYVDHGDHDLEMGGSIHYLVMLYEPGHSLRDYLAQKPRLDEEEALELILAVADALGAIHREGIIHCDLKPSNIFMRASGQPLILDFGIAKFVDYTSITQGNHPGTWRYIAPEQVSPGFDLRADLYSLGVILYEMLTGTPIFELRGSLFAFVQRVQQEMPELPSHRYPGVSPAVENVVLRLLEKQPYKRPADTKELVSAIHEAIRLKGTPMPELLDTGIGPKFYMHAQRNEVGPIREALQSGVTVAGLIYGAAQAFSSRVPVVTVTNAGVPVVIDPETHRLARSDFSRTKGLVALPYAKDQVTPLQPEHLTTITEYKGFTRKVMEHETSLGSDVAIAPFFHFPEMKSEWLGRNTKLLAEARLRMEETGDTRPLWAVISTDVELLCNERVQLELLNLYTRTRVDGYLFFVNFDEQTANAAQICQYARTLLRFRSTRRPVIAGRVGSLGLGLCAAGVTGFTSGMTTLENFTFTYFMDRSKMGGGPPQRFYLPDLLQNVSVEQARTLLAGAYGVRHSCPCPVCAEPLSKRLDWSHARRHFLHVRHEQLSALMRVPQDQRMARFLVWVDAAHTEARALSMSGMKVKHDHFPIWADAFQQLARLGEVA